MSSVYISSADECITGYYNKIHYKKGRYKDLPGTYMLFDESKIELEQAINTDIPYGMYIFVEEAYLEWEEMFSGGPWLWHIKKSWQSDCESNYSSDTISCMENNDVTDVTKCTHA